MLRALFLASLGVVIAHAASGQELGVLHIKVVVVDAERKLTPVPRHALLVSDNPASAAPRQITTGVDGTAVIRLRPGNYTVESDRPVVFGGRIYQWTQMVDIVAGRDASLEFTPDNADEAPDTPDAPATAATTGAESPLEADPSFLLPQWQDSVVAVWTASARASGFVIDARGLIATNQRIIGTATSVEVQLTPEIKVAGRVVAADAARDVAVLRVDPAAVASVRPVPLGCADAAKPPLADGQKLFTIGAPLREQKGITSGTSRTDAGSPEFMLARGSAGGPVFTSGGVVAGITSPVDDAREGRRGDSRVVRVGDVCGVVASAEQKMKDAAAPGGTHLPVEPARPFPIDALEAATQRRPTSLPYQMSSSGFDVTFITPVLAYGARYQSEQASGRGGRGGPDTDPAARALVDFGNWSEYVADDPPVLMIRATPKLVEGFWTTVARGAAMTQGVSLPPMKRVKSGFSRMRAFCGAAEVTPIHPFKVEQRVSDSVALYEGLYIFDPGALGPDCGTVKLVLYSEKEPEKGDTRLVDPKVLQKVWQDFAAYRALK